MLPSCKAPVLFDRGWLSAVLLLSPLVVIYAALLTVEGIAISWIDKWLPITTFESATWAALFVTASLLWCRLCLVGIGVWLLLRGNKARGPRFANMAFLWATASAIVAGAILAVDLWQHSLQYGGGSFSGETVRSMLLALVYAKIALVYPGVRLLFGVARMSKSTGFRSAWAMTAFIECIGLYVLLLLLKLAVETVLVTAISYLPFVAPFWFIPDELSRLRYFVGQGSRIAAESIGMLFFVAFFVALGGSRTMPCHEQAC